MLRVSSRLFYSVTDTKNGSCTERNCSKGALTPNWDDVRTYVRTYVTPENIVHSISRGTYELSPSAEIWCVYVTSINDGTQILTFLGIHNNRDFQNSRFFCVDLNILNSEVH